MKIIFNSENNVVKTSDLKPGDIFTSRTCPNFSEDVYMVVNAEDYILQHVSLSKEENKSFQVVCVKLSNYSLIRYTGDTKVCKLTQVSPLVVGR